MNPLTNIRNVQKLNERELELGIIGKKSWHDDYKDSAWVFIGGLPFDLSEGDILCVFSQYGEVVNLNLVRDHKTGKSKGFGFLCYEDQRSTVLSVDNLNGIKILGRTIRVDHVKDYKVPKEHENDDELIRKLREEGCAPRLEDSPPGDMQQGQLDTDTAKQKRKKGSKKVKKEKKKSRPSSSTGSSSESDDNTQVKVKTEPLDIKKEKEDRGYDRALHPSKSWQNGRSSRERDSWRSFKDDSRKRHKKHSDDEGDSEDGYKRARENNASRPKSHCQRDNFSPGRRGERDYQPHHGTGPRANGRDRGKASERPRVPGHAREARERQRDGGHDRERSHHSSEDSNRTRGSDSDRRRDRHR